MEKELLNSDKELLLKDLCARLPYVTMCATTDNDGSLPNIWKIVKADMINEDFFLIHDSYEASKTVDVKEIRPYLFSLSSMTEKQRYEISYGLQNIHTEHPPFGKIENSGSDNCLKCVTMASTWLMRYYNNNHFDYRGFIEKGLAIDATGLNIY